MSQTTEMFRVYQFFVDVHINVVTVRLQRLYLPVLEDSLENLTSSGTVLITVDYYFLFLVYQAPDIFLQEMSVHLYLAPGLVTVDNGVLDHGTVFQFLYQGACKSGSFGEPVDQRHPAQRHLMIR